MAYRPAQVYTGSGWDDIGDKRINTNDAIPQASVNGLTSALAAKWTSQTIWTSYTPTLGGSTTNPTMGSGSVSTGAWVRIGNTIVYRFLFVFGAGATAGSGFYYIPTPVFIKSMGSNVSAFGTINILDNSAGTRKYAIPQYNTSDNFYMREIDGVNLVASTTPWTWAEGDQIAGTVIFEEN